MANGPRSGALTAERAIDRATRQRIGDVLGGLPEEPAAVEDELRQSAVLEAMTLELDDRDRALAEHIGVEYSEVSPLPDWVKGMLFYHTAPSDDPNYSPHESPEVDHEFSMGPNRKAGTLTRKQWEEKVQNMEDYDPKNYVKLVRRARRYRVPGGGHAWYHPGTQIVARKEVLRKLKEGGFQIRPSYEFLPEASLPCKIDFMGVYCDYLARDPGELELHMRHWHQDEYDSGNRQQLAATGSAQLAVTQAQLLATTAQTNALLGLTETMINQRIEDEVARRLAAAGLVHAKE